VGAYRAASVSGAVYLVRGHRVFSALALDLTLRGEEGTGSYFGERVAGAGDLDGDGFPELAVGAPNTSRGVGRVYLFRGGTRGFDAVPAAMLEAPEGASGSFGGALGVHGDLDADGRTDLVVGAPAAQRRAGRVVLFAGRAGALPAAPGVVLQTPNDSAAEAGHSLASNGDLEGDGLDDLAVGAPHAREERGLVHLVRGRSGGPAGASAVLLAPTVDADSLLGAALSR
jgi:hypothetical protein